MPLRWNQIPYALTIIINWDDDIETHGNLSLSFK